MRSRDLAAATERALSGVARGRLRSLPVTLRFWDGSALRAQDPAPDAPVVSIRSPRALSYLVHEPSQLGLARAWVTGAVDVEGDLDQALRLRDWFCRISLSHADRIRLVWSSLRAAGPTVLRRPQVPTIEADTVTRG